MPAADSSNTNRFLAAAAAGDDAAVQQLLARHRAFLRRFVDVRIEPALRARLDASDVVQETMVVASQRFGDYVAHRPTSFRVWLRRRAIERLVEARRRHLAQKRDARRDVSVNNASSLLVARRLLRGTASGAAVRRELAEQVRGALSNLSEQDQEIILLRHAEELTNAEAAEVLEVNPGTASKRYGRALARLSTELRRRGLDTN